MDFSKLNASEKMATYASVAVAILAIYALVNDWGGLLAISLIGAIGVIAVVFIPQMSPGTTLPGSRGSLMLILGGGAAVFWAIAVLSWVNWIFGHLGRADTWIFLVGFAAALWLGWMSWQAFQAEGGKLVLGSSGSGTTATPPEAPAAPAAPAPAAPEPPAQAAPAAPPPAAYTPPSAPAAPPEAAPPMPEADAGMGSDEDQTS